MRLHPTTTHRRHLLVATALVLGVLTTGCKPWGPVTSQYNGHTVVSGEGYTNISASRVSDTLTITDTLNDGNSVYGSARYYFWLAGSSGDWAWRQTAGDATPEVENGKITSTESDGLRADSSRVRVISYACAQMGWPVPDSCSDPAIISDDY